MQTNLLNLSLDLLIEITKYIDIQSTLRLQCANKRSKELISDQAIWRWKCIQQDITTWIEHDNLQRHLIAFCKVKSDWMTGKYRAYKSDSLAQTESPRGICFLRYNGNKVLSSSWSGIIFESTIGLVAVSSYQSEIEKDDWYPPTPTEPLHQLLKGVSLTVEKHIIGKSIESLTPRWFRLCYSHGYSGRNCLC
jgi:hypothetical protein